MRVAIAGARLSEFSCAKHLTDTRYRSIRLERQGVLGERVAAWAVQGFLLRRSSGAEDEVLRAGLYTSAKPVALLKVILPDAWKQIEDFQWLEGLKGVPAINVHLWFDRKLIRVDYLLLWQSPLLNVNTDMSNTCQEYTNPDGSMLEIVLAPAEDWISEFDQEIVAATIAELELFLNQIPQPANLLKFKVIKSPCSVYRAAISLQACRPSQGTPILNFYLTGDYTMQCYLASMEGAVLSGKLTAQAIAQAYPLSDTPASGEASLQLPISKPVTNAATV